MKFFQIIMLLLFSAILLLVSVNFDMEKITLLQLYYMASVLFSLFVIPLLFYGKIVPLIKSKEVTNTFFTFIKFFLIAMYLCIALTFDFLKLDVFQDKVLYISSFLYYATMIYATLDIILYKINRKNNKAR